jgi:hypothetical protein
VPPQARKKAHSKQQVKHAELSGRGKKDYSFADIVAMKPHFVYLAYNKPHCHAPAKAARPGRRERYRSGFCSLPSAECLTLFFIDISCRDVIHFFGREAQIHFCLRGENARKA